MFDAFYININESFNQYIADDLLLDISKSLHEYGTDILKEYKGRVLDTVTFNGNIYAIPNLMPSTNQLYAVVRDSFLEKYEITNINEVS